LDAYAPKEVKTKIASTALQAMGLWNQKVLLVLDGAQEQVERSFRNIDGVSYTTSLQLNAYDVMCAKHILFVSSAYDVLENRLTK
jgi:ribosomal protein L4